MLYYDNMGTPAGSEQRGHFACSSASPTLAAGTGMGSSPTGVTVVGTDHSGVVSFTTGTSPAVNATIFTLSFTAAFTVFPKAVQITPASATAAALTAALPFAQTPTVSSFVLTSNATALTASTAYKFFYTVL